jgi:hypothetical protein
LPVLRLLCAAALFALAPFAARAGSAPDDPNSPLGTGDPCFDVTKVAESLSLTDSGSGDLFFADLPDCPNLCKKAGDSCTRFAKRAAKCESRFADDRSRFEIKTECAGLKSTELKDCSAPFLTKRDGRKTDTAGKLATELAACQMAAADCTGKCHAPP